MRIDFPNVEVIYTQDKQRGGHCIHEPIHSDTGMRDKTGVVGMRLTTLFYIHFDHFSLLSHSTNMT